MPQPNSLIHSTSPYLLQHAYNPIHWYAWHSSALAKAQQEDKPIILSIGYAACHWCHVMAIESFEDKAVAAIMNKNFVCIKVDRQERPDIDQVYIAAMQAMGLPVGWPLTIFLLPNQQPFYGGTYFPPKTWKQLLTNIVHAFKYNRPQLALSASQFTQAIAENTQGLALSPDQAFTQAAIQAHFHSIYKQLDLKYGSTQGAPKFPMPSHATWLLDYYQVTKDQRALSQLTLTLTHLALGGIYDHLGGGFFRYATDENWLVPHFEKMLYDNALLISLYASAYITTHDISYQQVIIQTIDFLEREMRDEKGAFYSALSADSQGIEGKFYTWTQAEIERVLGEDAPLLLTYFQVTKPGNWDNRLHILHRGFGEGTQIPNLGQEEIQNKLQQIQKTLWQHRATRPRPELDNNILTSWNGMTLKALVNAYEALGDLHYLDLARKLAAFIEQHLLQGNRLWHTYKQGQAGVLGYLEDYAWVARAFISLYQVTFEEKWLYQAQQLILYTLAHYWDSEKQSFYFTESTQDPLIARPQEIFDYVIPSSNAVMAHNIFDLGILLDQETWVTRARAMLSHMSTLLNQMPLQMTHWASLYIKQVHGVPVVAIIGPACIAWAQAIKQQHPSVLLVGTPSQSGLPWLFNKPVSKDKSTLYVCYGQHCQLPTHNLEEALAQLRAQGVV